MIGSRLAHYEITSHLGTGGMGEVYQATDSKLGRSVAIKLLPVAFASDAERLSRFKREAQVLASLNHPNIAQIYGLEDSGETRCIIMELVEGETLQARLKRGPIPVDEALMIAKQIAEALEAAHEKGIIHRDLKPGNVMMTRDGKVKVLDFGLAKAGETSSSNASIYNSPTMTSMAATNAGVILGTAAYMSPEQAKARNVDKRTDIFAFGCVLYEMLSGRPVFAGEDVTEIIARVVTGEPDLSQLPQTTPPAVHRLLRRTLKKDPRQRLSDIRDAYLEIEEAGAEPSLVHAFPAQASPKSSRRREVMWASTALLFLLATVGLAIQLILAPAPGLRTVRFDVLPPQGGAIDGSGGGFLSPDGRQLAFVVMNPDGKRQIWIRPLDSSGAQPLAGTEDAFSPFWSPDNQYIAFFAQGKLMKVAAAGGPAQFISNQRGRDGTWGSNGTILIGGLGGPLLKVAAEGGQPSAASELDASQKETTHDYPDFLPDGQHYLYLARNGPDADDTAVYVGALDSTERHALPGIRSATKYSSTGHVLFYREGTLMAQSFDLKRLELSGEPFPIAETVSAGPNPWFSVSRNGSLAYEAQPGSRLAETQLVWFDRSGKKIGEEPVKGRTQAPNLSRDGKQVALQVMDAAGIASIWLLDLVRGTNMRLTFDGPSGRPVFSPDGKQVVFSRPPGGVGSVIYQKSASGTGTDELLLEDGEPTDWSSDGQHILFLRGGDLWALNMSDRKATAVITGRGSDRRGKFSPDGKWIAYESNESGRSEVYVQRFPPSGERWQVSVNGGYSAVWRNDGRELFFNVTDQKMMAVDTQLGSVFAAGTPIELFEVPGAINNGRFIVSSDGQRFLLPIELRNPEPLTVLLDWNPVQQN